jgi:RNA-directed DNA polymerase
MSSNRQKTQLHLAFAAESRSESPMAAGEGIELPVAKRNAQSPTQTDSLMEEVCQRDNLWQALKRVQANKGAPGVDGMTVGKLPKHLKRHWPKIREQLLAGIYHPQPVKRVEIPKPDGGVRKLGIPTVGA